MFLKLIKGWLIFVGVSWTAYGASENFLAEAKLEKSKSVGEVSDSTKCEHVFVWKKIKENFEEGERLLKESREKNW